MKTTFLTHEAEDTARRKGDPTPFVVGGISLKRKIAQRKTLLPPFSLSLFSQGLCMRKSRLPLRSRQQPHPGRATRRLLPRRHMSARKYAKPATRISITTSTSPRIGRPRSTSEAVHPNRDAKVATGQPANMWMTQATRQRFSVSRPQRQKRSISTV